VTVTRKRRPVADYTIKRLEEVADVLGGSASRSSSRWT
jgi:hypothetical protein